MLQKIKILDQKLDTLDEINNSKFVFDKFNQINSQLETILSEINSTESINEQNSYSQEQQNIFKNLLNKIDKLEAKILYKAHLFEAFSKSNI